MYKIDEQYISQFIQDALFEDVRAGDVTALACIPADKRDKAILKVKSDGVLAGMGFAERVFSKLDPQARFKALMKDGDAMKFGDVAFEVECNSQSLLKAERLVLNTMQRMSGIATLSRQYADLVKDLPVQVLDTRKTTPLFRYFEKWAVNIGGSSNYRYGLFDRYMIKDNHVDACGSVTKAILKVAEYQSKMGTKLELTVEVRNLAELDEVLVLKATPTGKYINRVMLDNFSLPLLRKAVKIANHQLEVEASGGVTLKSLRKIALTGVDFISSGAITHSSTSLDLSLKVVK
jgi:nicotinate-nucleotide pyrophosphorylase (carboxylating)